MNRYNEKEEAVGISMFALIVAVVALILSGVAFFGSGCGEEPRFYDSIQDAGSSGNSDTDTDTDTDIDTDTDSDTESDTDTDTDTDTDADSDTDTDTDTDTDNDTDIDTDTDSDSDTDTIVDPNHVACDGEPSDCFDIGNSESEQFFGCCWQDVVYWCNNPKELRSKDCTEKGLVCGVKYWEGEPEYMWCILKGGE